MPQQDIVYRAIFNTTRRLYVFHSNLAEIAPVVELLNERGFMTSVAVSPSSLDRLISKVHPDIVLVELEPNVDMAPLRSLLQRCIGSRVYVLVGSTARAAEIAAVMRNGATFVFAAPFDPIEVLSQIEADLRDDLRIVGGATRVRGLHSLTDREREILGFVVAGETNKQISQKLEISPRTVEVHRSQAMRKMGARNTAEMIRIVLGRK